jgi:hypothetical protein
MFVKKKLLWFNFFIFWLSNFFKYGLIINAVEDILCPSLGNFLTQILVIIQVIYGKAFGA